MRVRWRIAAVPFLTAAFMGFQVQNCRSEHLHTMPAMGAVFFFTWVCIFLVWIIVGFERNEK